MLRRREKVDECLAALGWGLCETATCNWRRPRAVIAAHVVHGAPFWPFKKKRLDVSDADRRFTGGDAISVWPEGFDQDRFDRGRSGKFVAFLAHNLCKFAATCAVVGCRSDRPWTSLPR